MFEEFLTQLLAYVDDIASVVSTTAPLVWEMALLKVQVQMWNSGIHIFFSLILIGSGFAFKRDEETTRNWDGANWGASIFLWLLGLLVLCPSLYAIGARYINPNWYAIKLLLDASGIGN